MSEMITTPVGRLVEGSLYRKTSKDTESTDFYFAIAIPKGSETHWNQTPWGATIENVGKLYFPRGEWKSPSFSWKIIDGDALVSPGGKGRAPNTKEGFPGNWILKFSSKFSCKVFNRDGSQVLPEIGLVNLGDYVQVHAILKGNASEKSPGVYLNHMSVAFSAYGERITLSPASPQDARSAGFGQAPLPPGASATPVAAFTPPSAPPIRSVVHDVPPPAYPQILSVPPVPNVPIAPPVPSVPIRHMLPAANGLTYEQYKAHGWTDEQLVQNGFMEIVRAGT